MVFSGNPAWDILPIMYRTGPSEPELRQVDVSNKARVRHSTGLRMLERLEAARLVWRRLGESIYRKRLLRLTDHATDAMEALVRSGG